MNRQEHWNRVYRARRPTEVSWFQPRPEVSLELIAASGVSKDARIIDVGAGTSTLVDALFDNGYRNLAALDLSPVALSNSRARLGSRASSVEWFEADVTTFSPSHQFGLWHDRAVFHFLTEAEDRIAYVATLRRTLEPGGTAIISTFARDGPPKCSGLDVVRYDEALMLGALGSDFQVVEMRREAHRTPAGVEQRFIYFRLTFDPQKQSTF